MAKLAIAPQSGSVEEQHRINLVENVSRRMAIAQAQHDSNLVALLKKEQQQLEQSQSVSTPRHSALQSLQHLWHALKTIFKLRVERVADASGQHWWYGYDPRTGKSIYGESQSDIIRWIEENQLG